MCPPISLSDSRPRGTVTLLNAVSLAAMMIAVSGCSRSAQSQSPGEAQTQGQAISQMKPEIKPAPPTPIAIKRVELGEGNPWNRAWDRLIEESLPRNLISRRRERAVRALCPRFRTMTLADRRAFWAYFFQALAGAEAGLKPTADVRHTEPQVAVIDPVTHRIVRQEGLLQLAYMDSVRYGCDFDWQRDKDLPEHDPAKTILQPRNNLMCGIRIAENQLIKLHEPLLSDSSYWVTLRPDSPSFKIFLRQMANLPAACGSALRRPETKEIGVAPTDEEEKTQPGVAVEPAAVNPHADPQPGGRPAQHIDPGTASSPKPAADPPPLSLPSPQH